MTSLRDFFDQLERHEWFFARSDDPAFYTKGRTREIELCVIAAESPAHQALYDAFSNFRHGEGDQRAGGSKPRRPA